MNLTTINILPLEVTLSDPQQSKGSTCLSPVYRQVEQAGRRVKMKTLPYSGFDTFRQSRNTQPDKTFSHRSPRSIEGSERVKGDTGYPLHLACLVFDYAQTGGRPERQPATVIFLRYKTPAKDHRGRNKVKTRDLTPHNEEMPGLRHAPPGMKNYPRVTLSDPERREGSYRRVKMKTLPYPGFDTFRQSRNTQPDRRPERQPATVIFLRHKTPAKDHRGQNQVKSRDLTPHNEEMPGLRYASPGMKNYPRVTLSDPERREGSYRRVKMKAFPYSGFDTFRQSRNTQPDRRPEEQPTANHPWAINCGLKTKKTLQA